MRCSDWLKNLLCNVIDTNPGQLPNLNVQALDLLLSSMFVRDRFRTAPFKENRKSNIFFSKKGSSVFTFSVCLSVCVSVCSRPVGHSFWPRGLIFGMNDP